MEKEIAIVYIVAGISKRFGGEIKQFAKVGSSNETLIECSLNQAIKAGFTKIIFVVGNKTEEPFKKMFGSDYGGIPVFYASQKFDEKERERPWGTGDALVCAKELIDCPFIICNGDDLYGENTFKVLVNHIKENYENEDSATIGYNLIDVLSEKGNVNRAIFKTNAGYVTDIEETYSINAENMEEKGLKEDSPCSQNIFALHAAVIRELAIKNERFKEKNKDDRKAEFLLSNELSDLIKAGKLKMKIYPAVDKWIGITNPGDEEIVREFIIKNNIL